MPLPDPGFHPWDGADQAHVNRIRTLERDMQNAINGLGGIQAIRNMINDARRRLSEAVDPENPAMADVDHAARLAAVLQECDNVSHVVDDIIPPPPNAGAPANAQMHHFQFRFAGVLAPLQPLMDLYIEREQVTSARHTTRGINFNAEYNVPGLQARPQWRYVIIFIVVWAM